MLAVLVPLERWRPVEPIEDRRAVVTDVLYTLIHRLGLFRLVFFFTLELWVLDLTSWYSLAGGPTWQLDAIWPGVTDRPWVSFLLYLVILDALNYLIHRAQHQFKPWWALHALHHSQRQMTLWTDNRNHLLDDAISDVAQGAFQKHGVGVTLAGQLVTQKPGVGPTHMDEAALLGGGQQGRRGLAPRCAVQGQRRHARDLTQAVRGAPDFGAILCALHHPHLSGGGA